MSIKFGLAAAVVALFALPLAAHPTYAKDGKHVTVTYDQDRLTVEAVADASASDEEIASEAQTQCTLELKHLQFGYSADGIDGPYPESCVSTGCDRTEIQGKVKCGSRISTMVRSGAGRN